MPDFRVADTAPEHPKLRAAGLAAAGLWSLAGAVSMRDGTDGWVPEYWVATWPAGKRHAARLVEVRLWTREDRHGMPGYLFHDWLVIQRSSAQIDEEKQRARDRAAKSYANRAPKLRRRPDEDSAENLHDSLSLSLSLSPGGSVGGASNDPDARDDEQRPTPPNLDPNNPRCGDHRDIPATDRGPSCRACAAVRRQVDQLEPEPDPAMEARRAAIAACGRCDDRGFREVGVDRRPARCDHQLAAAAS